MDKVGRKKRKMNKVVSKKRNEIAELIDVLESSATIEQARESLRFASGPTFSIKGKIEKLVKRENQLKFIIIDRSDARREMMIFADMSADARRVTLGKYRKGKTAQIIGNLVSFGHNAICINRCKLVTQTVTKLNTKKKEVKKNATN